jgi:hypothetical protein
MSPFGTDQLLKVTDLSRLEMGGVMFNRFRHESLERRLGNEVRFPKVKLAWKVLPASFSQWELRTSLDLGFS